MEFTDWINVAMLVGFLAIVGTQFGRMYLEHRRRQARFRRMEQFRVWVQRPKNPEEAQATLAHALRVIENPHTDYHGPWER